MDDAKQCPFCASLNLEVQETPALFVVCGNCGCEGPYHHTDIDQAIVLWNNRPGDDVEDELEIDHGEEEE